MIKNFPQPDFVRVGEPFPCSGVTRRMTCGDKEGPPKLGNSVIWPDGELQGAQPSLSVTRQFCGKMTLPAGGQPGFTRRFRGIWRALADAMRRRAFVFLMLLTSTGFAAAKTSANLLGMNYSEWFAPFPGQIATDSSGALYILGYYSLPNGGMSATSITKLSADGTTILWQDMPGFLTNTMAVSPAGDVFVVSNFQSSDTAVYVTKLAPGGSGVAWTAAAGFTPLFLQSYPPVVAADSQGRAYLAAPNSPTASAVVRINAAGNAIDYTANITGLPTAIAADGSGAAVVAGNANPTGFVTRVAPDGSAGYYTTLPQAATPTALALDASGNAVVIGSGLLQRLNATGAIAVSTKVPGSGATFGLDAAGNAYVAGIIGQLYPVRNSIAPCLPSPLPTGSLPMETTVGTAPLLTVVAPDGSIPQITYVPGASVSGRPILSVGPNATVFLAAAPGAEFTPTQTGPFPQGPPYTTTVLLQLSPQAAAQTVSLACVGNAATYFIRPVAPGEIVALIGSGLGPMQGTQTQATAQSAFPVQASGVKVTFDGTPAPLLWVQDSQINAIVPWSLKQGTNTEICVSSGGKKTNCLTWPVAQTAPGVFTVDGVHAAALNQDGSINTATNPAAQGSIVSAFATGLGPINQPQADGALVGVPLPSNVLQTVVAAETLAISPPFGLTRVSSPVPTTYAGPAPYLVAGVSQINFQIPPPNAVIDFYLAPGALNSINLPASTTRSLTA